MLIRLECFLLEVGGAFDGADQVRDEVGPALVGGFDVGPGGADGLVLRDQLVVFAAPGAAGKADQQEDDE